MQVRKEKMMISLRTQFWKWKEDWKYCILAGSTDTMGFPGGSVVKNLPARQEMGVWSLGGKIPWRRKGQPPPAFLTGKFCGQEPGRLQCMGSQKSRTWLGNYTHAHRLQQSQAPIYLVRVYPPTPAKIKYQYKRLNNHTSKSAGCQLFWKFHRDFLVIWSSVMARRG